MNGTLWRSGRPTVADLLQPRVLAASLKQQFILHFPVHVRQADFLGNNPGNFFEVPARMTSPCPRQASV